MQMGFMHGINSGPVLAKKTGTEITSFYLIRCTNSLKICLISISTFHSKFWSPNTHTEPQNGFKLKLYVNKEWVFKEN